MRSVILAVLAVPPTLVPLLREIGAVVVDDNEDDDADVRVRAFCCCCRGRGGASGGGVGAGSTPVSAA